MSIRAGSYRHRLILQKRVDVRDDYGQPVPSWYEHAQRYAAKRMEGASERAREPGRQARSRVSWRMHGTAGLAADMRILAPKGATTLHAAATSATGTTLSVERAHAFPQEGDYRVKVGAELMNVTGGQGTSVWTVERGVDGTEAATHDAGAAVQHMGVYNVTAAGDADGFGRETVVHTEEADPVSAGVSTGTETVLRLPGTGGNYASAPDSAALSPTGDLDLRARVALDAWSPGGSDLETFIAKWDASGTLSYLFYLRLGPLFFAWSEDGTSAAGLEQSTESVPFSAEAGTVHWVRVTLDVDDGGGQNVVTFYTADGTLESPTANDFTQLGDPIINAGTTSIADSAADLAVGAQSNGTTSPLTGDVYRAQVYDGIDGTKVFDADATRQTPGITSFREDANEATVTVNQSGGDPAAIVAP